jgi:hypothetical protein
MEDFGKKVPVDFMDSLTRMPGDPGGAGEQRTHHKGMDGDLASPSAEEMLEGWRTWNEWFGRALLRILTAAVLGGAAGLFAWVGFYGLWLAITGVGNLLSVFLSFGSIWLASWCAQRLAVRLFR